MSRFVLTLLRSVQHFFDRIAWRVRDHGWRLAFGTVGNNFVFDPVTSVFVTPSQLSVGDDCFFNANAHVSGDVRLGHRVLVGPGVKLLSGNHLYGIEGHHARFLKASAENPELLKTQTIESDVWIGAACVVLGGVTIGAGSILAAGSVANRDIPPYVIAAGAPARPVRRIFDDATLARHLLKLGKGQTEVDAIVLRRRRACGDQLALAVPPRPDRFLYGDEWVTNAVDPDVNRQLT